MKRGSGILAVFAVVFCMLFSLWKETAVPIRAADGTFQKVTLSLNSNASDGASIDLYLRDSVHYIAIDDLCTLARCTRSVDGGLISVAQGIRRVEFQEDGTADCLPLDAASFPAQPERPCVNLYPVWGEYLRASGEEEAYFLPADYDGDGRKEAFGFTGTFDGQKGYDGVKIYYISAVGEVECVRSRTEYGEPLYGYLLTQPAGGTEEGENYFLSASGHRFLVWEISAYGSGSSSVILGVKDGKAYEPSISERYMTFQQTGPAEFTGLVSDFSEGGHAYREQRFAYEKSTGEFEPAGGETGIDEEKKTAVNKERKQP